MNDSRYNIGQRVLTVEAHNHVADDWNAEALASRKWGVRGEIVAIHDAHGLTYEVEHDDCTIGHYEHHELEVELVTEPGYYWFRDIRWSKDFKTSDYAEWEIIKVVSKFDVMAERKQLIAQFFSGGYTTVTSLQRSKFAKSQFIRIPSL